MNSRLVKAALAGVAALTLAAGGGTFASWSDFGSIADNNVRAGVLALQLSDGDGGVVTPIDFGGLYPGQTSDMPAALWIASNKADSAPNGNLLVTIQSIRDYENGCGSASETALDPTCTSSSPGDGTLGGELSQQLLTTLTASFADSPAQCVAYPTTYAQLYDPAGDPSHAAVWTNRSVQQLALNTLSDVQVGLAKALGPGHGVCLYFRQFLPMGSTDSIQSDSVKYNLKFDLVQSQ